MLTDMQLRALKPAKKIYKVADQRGQYAAVIPAGAVSFRYGLPGERSPGNPGYRPLRSITLSTEATQARRTRIRNGYSLPEARLLRDQVYGAIQRGESPSRSKVEKRVEATEVLTFGKWAEKYFVETALADSTRAMRKLV
ncbi:integrase arm-type DNA-binding domain-containing protein [Paraburkholderia madseniana]|uniref:integrase arm-type DNA-binding domain-containing protein n=1 Tax=Paraburkholderia sp. SECH4 TaxID=2936948 RepID=UPI002B1CB777|nr:integrase arm-type DNA-binding domain-containing protein [Paraburkholderia madseniana]